MGVYWIHLAQDKDCSALVTFWFHKMLGIYSVAVQL